MNPHQFYHTFSVLYLRHFTSWSLTILPPRASIFSFTMHYSMPLSLATWRWVWHSWRTTWLPSQNQQRTKRRGKLDWRGNSMCVCGCMCIHAYSMCVCRPVFISCMYVHNICAIAHPSLNVCVCGVSMVYVCCQCLYMYCKHHTGSISLRSSSSLPSFLPSSLPPSPSLSPFSKWC